MNSYEAWYAKNPKFIVEKSKTISSIPKTHVKVKEVEAENLEEVFLIMQGHIWSPYGEARELIKSLGLHHTSMSVGDIVLDKSTNTWHQVDFIGFIQLKKK